MSEYRLARTALDDLDQISAYLEEKAGVHVAQKLEESLFNGFERLAGDPGLGHRRSDLTRRDFHFFLVEPYLIVYARDSRPLMIHSVLHASRNIHKLLRARARQ